MLTHACGKRNPLNPHTQVVAYQEREDVRWAVCPGAWLYQRLNRGAIKETGILCLRRNKSAWKEQTPQCLFWAHTKRKSTLYLRRELSWGSQDQSLAWEEEAECSLLGNRTRWFSEIRWRGLCSLHRTESTLVSYLQLKCLRDQHTSDTQRKGHLGLFVMELCPVETLPMRCGAPLCFGIDTKCRGKKWALWSQAPNSELFLLLPMFSAMPRLGPRMPIR